MRRSFTLPSILLLSIEILDRCYHKLYRAISCELINYKFCHLVTLFQLSLRYLRSSASSSQKLITSVTALFLTLKFVSMPAANARSVASAVSAGRSIALGGYSFVGSYAPYAALQLFVATGATKVVHVIVIKPVKAIDITFLSHATRAGNAHAILRRKRSPLRIALGWAYEQICELISG